MNCDICRLPIGDTEVRYGAGDGSGQRFAHDVCWLKREVWKSANDIAELHAERDRLKATVYELRTTMGLLKRSLDESRRLITVMHDEVQYQENRMTRPPFAVLTKAGAYIACSCGNVLQTVETIREHWQDGHFDYVSTEVET